jgi:hypothetical protein
VTRYLDYDPVKKQMSKIHKPHRESGYIARVQFEETQDTKGNRDWEMFYTPGPRAIAEFSAFSRRSIAPPPENNDLRNGRAVHRTLELASPADELEEQLIVRGVSPRKARELLANLQPNQKVLDQLEYTDFVIRQAPAGKFHNPPGLYIRNIEHNISPPAGYESSRQHRFRQQMEEERDASCARISQLEVEYEEYVQETINALVGNMAGEEFQRRQAEQRKVLKCAYPNMLKEHLDDLATVSVRAAIKSSNSQSFTTFEAFCRDRNRTASLNAVQTMPCPR